MALESISKHVSLCTNNHNHTVCMVKYIFPYHFNIYYHVYLKLTDMNGLQSNICKFRFPSPIDVNKCREKLLVPCKTAVFDGVRESMLNLMV